MCSLQYMLPNRHNAAEVSGAGLFELNPLFQGNPAPKICLSYGMGLDSTALLLRWLEEPASRGFDLSDLVVLTAMTGEEFDTTGEAVETHILPRLADQGVRFIQVGRTQRRTTKAGQGVVVLDDSDSPRRLFFDGDYTLGDEMLSAGTVPQLGGLRACSVHSKGDCLDPVIAAVTAGRPYRHVIGYELGEYKRVLKDQRYNTGLRTGWYPLADDWGWDREKCQEYVTGVLGVAWEKSACVFCCFALATQAGRDKTLERFRRQPSAGVRALLIEHVARSLNPAQTLVSGSSLADLVRQASLTQVAEGFSRVLQRCDYSVYEVRRLTRPARNGGRGMVARSVRVLASGDRVDMDGYLRELPGSRIPGFDGITRHIVFERSVDGVDHLYVAAPAGVDAKERDAFDTWWDEALRARVS